MRLYKFTFETRDKFAKLYGSVFIFSSALDYLDEYPSNKLNHGIFLEYKLLALKKISTIDFLEYQKSGTGKLVQRIENGAMAGKNILYDFWFRMIRQLIPAMVFSLYYIWRIHSKIALIILSGYIFVFVVTNVLLKFLYQIKERILQNEEVLNYYLVRGFLEMVVFRMECQFPNEIKKANAAKKDIVDLKVKMAMIHEAFFGLFAVLVGMLNVIILVYAWYNRTISVGAIVALLSLIENAYTPVAIFNVLYVQYKLDKAAYERFTRFLEAPDDRRLVEGKRMKEINGDIEIKNLSFSYGERNILKKIDLTIHKGEKIVLVGESGSGKSTFIKVIAGLLKYEEGSVLIGGMELKDCCLDDFYRKISYMNQDSSVFDGTLRENLVFDSDMENEKIMDVLTKTQLLPLLEMLPEGLETRIGERGAKLSGGEKQRVALARILLKRNEILLLDEATSAMDNITEEKVVDEMMRFVGNDRTVIAIAHKMRAVTRFDRIVVFKDGRILAQGKFEELMANCPYFMSLYQADSQ